MSVSSHDDEVDDLYGLRPAEFVPARDALAKRLRAAGRRDEANAVKALPRPTAAAWAVNQMSRLEPEWTQALANAGRRLEEAQARLLEHGDRTAWREATVAQREAIDRLLGLAERLLREERGGVTPALREQVRQTLQAATLDADAREAVCAGRLARELQASGLLGAGTMAGPAGDTATGRATRGRRADDAAAGKGAAAEAAGGAAKADDADRAAQGGRAGAAPKGGRGRAGGAAAARDDEAAADSSASSSAAAEREARAARRAAEREARAELRRAERLVTAARAAADRAAKAEARARKAHDAAADALADAQQAERERAEELQEAEAAAAEAADTLAERQQAEEAARRALEQLDA